MPRCGLLQGAEFGIRVNSVAPGPVDTSLFRSAFPPEHLQPVVEASQLIARTTQPEEVRVELLQRLRSLKEQRSGGLRARFSNSDRQSF